MFVDISVDYINKVFVKENQFNAAGMRNKNMQQNLINVIIPQ